MSLQLQLLKIQNELIRLQRAEAILDERDRQDKIWGTQEHSLSKWMTILSCWKGKLAYAILHKELPLNRDWRFRAIQVAAIALAMVEQTPEEE